MFDLALPLSDIQTLLRTLGESVAETAICVVIALCGPSITLLYVEHGIPFFAVVDKVDDFAPTDLYETTAAEVLTVLVPALPVLYPLFSGNAGTISVLGPLQIVVRESEGRPFAALVLLGSPVSAFTAERAAAASRAIASAGGVVHIGATEHFKRLSALAQCNFGFVFGISTLVPSVVKKLVEGSRPIAIKVFCPRFLELEKVTGGDGTVRSTALLTVIKIKALRGCSGRMGVDYGRIDGTPTRVRVLEVVKTDSARFLKLHTFTCPTDATEFERARDSGITQHLVLKAFASDVLRASWGGSEWEPTIAKFLKGRHVDKFRANSCLADLAGRPDRAALRLFYVLQCLVGDLTNRLVPVQDGHVFVAPPSLYVHKNGDPISGAEEAVVSEWPFEVRVLADVAAFRLVVEQLGGQFE
jgi:hypothetical protein